MNPERELVHDLKNGLLRLRSMVELVSANEDVDACDWDSTLESLQENWKQLCAAKSMEGGE